MDKLLRISFNEILPMKYTTLTSLEMMELGAAQT